VRQVWAVILLVVFGAPCVVSVLLADSTSSLPACCRRDGQHQCTLRNDPMSAASEPGVQAVGMKCPVFPRTGPISSHSETLGAGIARAVFAALIQHPSVRPQVEAQYRISYSRASQKRGPPVVLS
jgi:hypothetical protein